MKNSMYLGAYLVVQQLMAGTNAFPYWANIYALAKATTPDNFAETLASIDVPNTQNKYMGQTVYMMLIVNLNRPCVATTVYSDWFTRPEIQKALLGV